MPDADPADPTHLPVDEVRSWLLAHGVTLRGTVAAELVAGGRSNLTYLLTDIDGTRVVLRRPPLAGVIASAHDVLREGRIMTALAPTAVPVPPVLAIDAGGDLLDAPFIVMDYIDGIVLRDEPTARRELVPDARARSTAELVDALVHLHAVVPAEVGLGVLGPGTDHVARQLHRWAGQLDKLGVDVDPRMEMVHARLRTDVPEQREITLVHGDFRPGNTIVRRDGTVAAVLDWELATLGDPLTDVGWLVAYWGDIDGGLPMSVPTIAEGFGSSAEFVDHYLAASGRSPDDMAFYIAFALWRLAAILLGVQARARRGAYGSQGGEAVATASAGDRITRVIDAAEEATGRARR